jgi:hypothetical protein
VARHAEFTMVSQQPVSCTDISLFFGRGAFSSGPLTALAGCSLLTDDGLPERQPITYIEESRSKFSNLIQIKPNYPSNAGAEEKIQSPFPIALERRVARPRPNEWMWIAVFLISPLRTSIG